MTPFRIKIAKGNWDSSQNTLDNSHYSGGEVPVSFPVLHLLFSSKINGKENKPTPSKLSFQKDPVSMRLVCLGCELENNKPELCSFSRAKMKKLCTTKNEKAHDSLHFPGSPPGWLLITELVKDV